MTRKATIVDSVDDNSGNPPVDQCAQSDPNCPGGWSEGDLHFIWIVVLSALGLAGEFSSDIHCDSADFDVFEFGIRAIWGTVRNCGLYRCVLYGARSGHGSQPL